MGKYKVDIDLGSTKKHFITEVEGDSKAEACREACKQARDQGHKLPENVWVTTTEIDPKQGDMCGLK